MNTSEIFDSNTLPERRLNVCKTVALHQHKDGHEFLRSAKYDMAMDLATKIIEDNTVFSVKAYTVGGCSMLEYKLDCIVLTADEYARLTRVAFTNGVKHAQGFVPMPSHF